MRLSNDSRGSTCAQLNTTALATNRGKRMKKHQCSFNNKRNKNKNKRNIDTDIRSHTNWWKFAKIWQHCCTVWRCNFTNDANARTIAFWLEFGSGFGFGFITAFSYTHTHTGVQSRVYLCLPHTNRAVGQLALKDTTANCWNCYGNDCAVPHCCTRWIYHLIDGINSDKEIWLLQRVATHFNALPVPHPVWYILTCAIHALASDLASAF